MTVDLANQLLPFAQYLLAIIFSDCWWVKTGGGVVCIHFLLPMHNLINSSIHSTPPPAAISHLFSRLKNLKLLSCFLYIKLSNPLVLLVMLFLHIFWRYNIKCKYTIKYKIYDCLFLGRASGSMREHLLCMQMIPASVPRTGSLKKKRAK